MGKWMHRNHLFNHSRLQLASWYAGVMGAILSLCGVAVYQMNVQDHWQALERELKSISGTLHDGLEPILKQPGQMEPTAQQLLPGLCISGSNCTDSISRVHVLGTVQRDDSYVRFADLSNRVIATVGQLPQVTAEFPTSSWQTLQTEGTRYYQHSLLLKTAIGQPWGYMQIGRSLNDYDAHLTSLRAFLFLGLPIAMLLIGGASWWLAGLAMQPVYQSYQQIQQFTADAAHELRTPLAAIQATVEATLGTDNLTLQEACDTMQTLKRQNSRLAQLVQDLLLLSRMDLQVLPLKKQPCCLNDLVSDLVEEFASLAIAAHLTLQIHTHQPLYVSGDSDQLYRLFANLIDNAIQYTSPGGKVIISLNREEHYAVVRVQDTGIGIAPEEQPRIFDRFYRVSHDRSRSSGGAGLGLAIAQAIAQFHNGSIQVQSELGRGSVFTIRLP